MTTCPRTAQVPLPNPGPGSDLQTASGSGSAGSAAFWLEAVHACSGAAGTRQGKPSSLRRLRQLAAHTLHGWILQKHLHAQQPSHSPATGLWRSYPCPSASMTGSRDHSS